MEIPGASYDHMDGGQVNKLMDFAGINNIDFCVRIGRDISRKAGCLRGRQRRDE